MVRPKRQEMCIRDRFRLLLMYSSGTKYAGFLDDLVRADVQETIKLIAELKARGVPAVSYTHLKRVFSNDYIKANEYFEVS